ncbi:ArnT family glycosyltransferase [Trichothermofontia sp.]
MTWDQHPPFLWLLSAVWVLLLGGIVFLWHLGSTGLLDETEPLFAEAARQMTVTGDWLTPYFNGEHRFDKPPLIYWLMAIGYQTIGVNEWAVRLPSAWAAIGVISLGGYTLARFSQFWLTAWIGVAVMALGPEMMIWGRVGVSDMLLTGCMGSALFAFFLGYAQPQLAIKQRWYLATYLLIALAVLTKGPVGLILPALTIGIFALYLDKFRELWQEVQPGKGLLLVAAIAVPWYILVIGANGEAYIEDFFGYHNVERFTRVVNNHAAPWYFYFLVVSIGLLPWSVYLPAALLRLRVWQRSQWQARPRLQHLGLFCGSWFISIFGFFTLAVTKLPSYVLPLMPAAAILVALLIEEMRFWQPLPPSPAAPKLPKSWRYLYAVSSWGTVLLMVLLAIALYLSPRWLGGDPVMPELPEAFVASGARAWGVGIWGVAAIVATALLLRQRSQWLWGVNVVAFVAFILFTLQPTYALVDTYRQLPLRQLATAIVAHRQPDEEVIMMGFKKPSLVFYTRQPITYLRTEGQIRKHLRQQQEDRHDSAEGHQQERAATPKMTDYPAPSVLILAYPAELQEDLNLSPDTYQALDRAGVYQLVRVAKSDVLAAAE